MSIETFRPQALVTQMGSTFVGAAGYPQALNDDSDSSYVRQDAGVPGLVAMTSNERIPDINQERIKRVAVRARMRRHLDVAPITRGSIRCTGGFGSVLFTSIGNVPVNVFSSWFDITWATQSQYNNGLNASNWMVSNDSSYPSVRFLELYGDFDYRLRPAVTNIAVSDEDPFSALPSPRVADATQRPWFRANRTYGYSGMIGETVNEIIVAFPESTYTDPGFDPNDPNSVFLTWWPTAMPIEWSQTNAPLLNVERTVRAPDPFDTGKWRVYWFIVAHNIPSDWYAEQIIDASFVEFEMAFVPPPAPLVGCTVNTAQQTVSVTVTPQASPAWTSSADNVVEVQRRIDGGPWQLVPMDGQGAVIGTTSMQLVDRFAPRSWCVGGSRCPGTVWPIEYRARVYGQTVDGVVVTNWTTCGPLTICHDGLAWLRHPVDSSLDVALCVDEDDFDLARPFGVERGIAGGVPTVSSGQPGLRDHTIIAVCENTSVVLEVANLLQSALFWYSPNDPSLPGVWQAPDTASADTRKVAHARLFTIPCVGVNAEPVVIPEPKNTGTSGPGGGGT